MFISSAYAQTTQTFVSETPIERIEEAAEHANRVFPPFDFSHYGSHLFWLIICFGLFYLFISRVVVPRIGGVIETRRDRIASDFDQAARMKQETDSAIATYERELDEARSRAHAIAQKAGDEVKLKADADRKSTEASLEKKLSEAEARISKIRDKAMQDVGMIAEETAVEIVKELIGSTVNQKTANNAVKAVQN